jgi:hypothetical protein
MRAQRKSWRVVIVLAAWSAVQAPRLAAADPTPQDRAAARALFDEGRRLAHDGKYADACPKFEDSQRMDAGIGTLFNLADCYEHIGRTASAWSDFLEVADTARSAGETEREGIARERASRLVPHLPHLIFVRSDPGAAGQIRLDGSALGEGALGAGLPVDPGKHLIEAVGPGKKPWASQVDVGDSASVTVTVPALEDEPAPAPVVSTAASAAPPAQPRAPPVTTWQRPLGIALGGAGIVGVGIGTTFGLMASSAWNNARAACGGDPTRCTNVPSGSSYRSTTETDGTVSTVGFIAGGLMVATGAVLFLTGRHHEGAPAAGVTLAPTVGPRFASVTLDGAF